MGRWVRKKEVGPPKRAERRSMKFTVSDKLLGSVDICLAEMILAHANSASVLLKRIGMALGHSNLDRYRDRTRTGAEFACLKCMMASFG